MALWQQYLQPKTLAEAMDAFANAPRPLASIAGGTDLMLDLEQGRHAPVHTLIDVTGIQEMLALEIRDDRLFVGAGLSVNRVVTTPIVAQHAQALVEAGTLIAGPQVRNVATLGGNVAHALPAADGTIALTALDAEAEIAGLTGTRRIPFNKLFLSPGKSSLKQGEELLVGFYLPLKQKNQASCFKRIMRPQGVALPIMNCAVWLEREKDIVKDIHIAVGPGAPTPWRATEAEKFMAGKPMNDETINTTLEVVLAQIGFRSSPRRASADYRRHIVSGLFRDTLEAAWERAE
jgi:xanthine dehydrogenase FAD-binding subunit